MTGSGLQVTIACSANRLSEAESGASLSMGSLTLLGCTTGGGGLAINSKNADLALSNMTIRNFTSNSGADGAAIAHTGGSLTPTRAAC